MKKKILTSGIIAAGLLLAGCGGGSNAAKEPEAVASDGRISVTVGTQPIANGAPLWLGKNKGIFEKHGIDLDIKTAESGAHIPGIISGSFDFAFANSASVMMAADKGLDVKFVVGGASSTTAGPEDTDAVVVAKDSSIKSVKDLEGKKVAVTVITSLGSTSIREAVKKAGGDPSKVEFVEVNFADSEAALTNGQVDAAWLTEPFKTKALDHGAKVVSYNYKDMYPNLDIATYAATGAYMKANPEAVEKFRAAMTESLEYATAHPDEVRATIKTYAQIDDNILQRLTLPEFRGEFNKDGMNALATALLEYKAVTKMPDLQALLPN